MNVVVAMDSMKGSLTSMEGGNAVKNGIHLADASARVMVYPLADGGEGTMEALTTGMHGKFVSVYVSGPLGNPVLARYGIVENKNSTGNVAVMEMAQAAGITLIPENKRDPLYATTFGVGEMIKDAIEKGCRHFIIGIGGSATNDGGTGMLKALGYEFLDTKGSSIALGAIGLKDLVKISVDHVLPELEECEFRIACDVTNPLCGPEGCSAIFAPQKGATKETVEKMDAWLFSFAQLAEIKVQKQVREIPGTGAAGGLGFAFLAFLNGTLKSGVELVLETLKIEKDIKEADIVITGEGRLDGQSAFGKAPIGVAALAKKYDIPVVAFAGSVGMDAEICNQYGIDSFFPILHEIKSLDEAMEKDAATVNLKRTAEQVIRLWNTCLFSRN